MADNQIVGNRLRQMRRDRDLTMEQLAKDIGASRIAIGKYEHGERVPRDDIKKKLADYFGLSVGDLFFGEGDKQMDEYKDKTTDAEARGDGVTLRALLEHERREARGDDDGQAGATDEKEGAAMVTFNDLLELVEVDVIELVFQLTDRLNARVVVVCDDMAQVDDATRLYGERRVKRFTPAFHGDERVVVWLV